MSAPVAAPNSDTGNERNGRDEQQGTSFDQLQDVHFVEEKTNEALLVVKGNQDVLDSLRQHYQDSFDMLRYDDDLDVSQFQAIPRFRDRVERVQKELVMQQHRLETLLKMIADRRSLLQSTVQHRSTLMNYMLAEKAQESTDNMAKMTHEMQNIAQSTKTETVSMRIVTFVTLVYLPGTFISVSVLMVSIG
ncbi:hypothetical protein LTR09_011059 [Extremus antarcticus]|uniref:Uncharacterized protein n=1 Tax=Extremus antarcticus TaxID=702011 RepID=A0AAJ0G855_9PEZI|nr:hypothetical protein LTR09_011059 [Extremus antarcticus]